MGVAMTLGWGAILTIAYVNTMCTECGQTGQREVCMYEFCPMMVYCT